jgi:hypothetical protein
MHGAVHQAISLPSQAISLPYYGSIRPYILLLQDDIVGTISFMMQKSI